MVITLKDELIEIKGWHNADDDQCEPDDATFVTFQFPDGKWGYVTLSNFNYNSGAN